MAGFLRFLIFFALLLAVLVLVVLPLALSPLLTQMVRDMGVRADHLEVTVAPLDPSLLFGRSRRVNLIADNVDASPARIAHVDLALGDASYFDRSFETISGEISAVTVDIGGQTVSASSISLSGPARAAAATARMSAAETEQLIRVAANRAGLVIDGVNVSDSGVTVNLRGLEADARIAVRGGALLLQPGFGGAIVLLQPAPSDPWELTEAWISERGLNVSGVVNADRLVRQLAADR